MFDSENTPLVTRFEAGDGVLVTYSTNSDGEGVYKAELDSTWLSALITSNQSGALTLSAADEARIVALEAAIGIVLSDEPEPEPAPVATGTTGTTEVLPSTGGQALLDDLTITYSLVSFDGTVLVSETSFLTEGNDQTTLAIGMYAQMTRNNAMLRYMTPSYTDGKVILTWNPEQLGSTIRVNIDIINTAVDTVTYTVTDY